MADSSIREEVEGLGEDPASQPPATRPPGPQRGRDGALAW